MAEDTPVAITLLLTPTAVARLRGLAFSKGYKNSSGRHAGTGNISGFLEAMGHSEWNIVPTGKYVEARAAEIQRILGDLQAARESIKRVIQQLEAPCSTP